MLTIHGLVERQSRTNPEAVAVREPKRSLTYAALDRRAEALANRLRELGVRPGDRVGVFQKKSTETVAALIAILKTGASYVPIDPLAPAERAGFILQHAGVSVVFSAAPNLEKLRVALLERGHGLAGCLTPDHPPPSPAGLGTIVPLSENEVATTPADTLPSSPPAVPAAIAEDLAYILYTSGSTGTPKGVAISHAQSLAFVAPASQVFGLSAADVLASHAPFNFDLSVIDLFCAFHAGASVALLPESWLGFPAKVSQWIQDQKITVWNSVPSALIQLAGHGALEKRDLSNLRLIMFAGEPFPLKHLRILQALVPKVSLMNVYGQTEANSSTYFPITQIPGDGQPLPIGKTFPNYQVFLLDEKGAPIDRSDVPGELYIRGGAVARGYYRDPERTALAFVKHPLRPDSQEIVYRSGDRAVYDGQMNLVFLGRNDSAIKCRGFRVEPQEIEAAADQYPDVAESALVPVPNEATGHLLVLFVGTKAEGFDPLELRGYLTQKLPRYMIPDRVLVRSNLPRGGTGKIDRKALFPAAEQALSSCGV